MNPACPLSPGGGAPSAGCAANLVMVSSVLVESPGSKASLGRESRSNRALFDGSDRYLLANQPAASEKALARVVGSGLSVVGRSARAIKLCLKSSREGGEVGRGA